MLKESKLSTSGPTWSKPEVSGAAVGDTTAELDEPEGTGVAEEKPEGVAVADVFGPVWAHPNRSRPMTSTVARDK